MGERRKFKRRYLAFYSRVFETQSHQMLGHVVDMTPQGLMLISETPLPLDTNFSLEIELPEGFASKRAITFSARSRWSQVDLDPQFHNIGFELVKIEPEDVGVVQNIVDTFGFRDNVLT